MSKLLQPGTPVEITTSKHSDVQPGTVGRIEDVILDGNTIVGYGVKITQSFHLSKDTQRTIFFPHNVVKEAPKTQIQQPEQ